MKIKVTEKEFIKYHSRKWHAGHVIRWPRYVMLAGCFLMYAMFFTTAPPVAYVGIPLFVISAVPIVTVFVRGVRAAKSHARDLLKSKSEPFIEVSRTEYRPTLIKLYKEDNDSPVPQIFIGIGIFILFYMWSMVAKPLSYAGIGIFVASFIPWFVQGRRLNRRAEAYADEEMKK